MSTFRSRLEEALSMRNMTAAELSRRTGIGEGAISQYRKGAYEATQKNLGKMAVALGVSIPWLMGATDTTPVLFNEEYSMTKGDRIQFARKRANMTQGELGAACGTTKQTIYKYESGVVTNIPIERIERIAEATGVPPAFLMGWTDTYNL